MRPASGANWPLAGAGPASDRQSLLSIVGRYWTKNTLVLKRPDLYQTVGPIAAWVKIAKITAAAVY